MALLLLLPAGDVAAQSEAASRITIAMSAVILAEPGAETPLAIQVGPPGGIPPNTFVRIRGLPGTASLSEGHAIAPGAWAVPLSGLPTLRIIAPAGMAARSEISVSLVDLDGNVLRETKSALVVAAAAVLARPAEPAARAAAPPPAPVPKAEPPPQQLTEQFNAALRMLAKGDELLVAGNISLARLYYQRAADMGLARGALALAGTFDANELQRRRVIGVQPDPELARQWYERAKELGAPEAAERLSRLGTR